MIDRTIDIIKKNDHLWSRFSSKEEYDPIIIDKYGRFTHYLSNHRNVFEPSVSELLVNNGLKFDFPEGQPFALCITHDIDTVYEKKPLKKGYQALTSIRKGKFFEGVRYVANIPFNKKPWWNFNEMICLEERYGAKSTFFCMALEEGEEDWNYDAADLKQELLNLLDGGWDIGLHGGHKAFNNPMKLNKEKETLEKVLGRKISGYRNHYLRFQVPYTWEILSKCGFQYDSTFGYPDCIGFRNGMCHPFKPYNRNDDTVIDIVEIPLIIMDGTLFESYMRLSLEVAWQATKRLIDSVEKLNGVITILWHNTQMYGESLLLYKKILDYCYNKKAWLTSGDEINRWFSMKNF